MSYKIMDMHETYQGSPYGKRSDRLRECMDSRLGFELLAYFQDRDFSTNKKVLREGKEDSDQGNCETERKYGCIGDETKL